MKGVKQMRHKFQCNSIILTQYNGWINERYYLYKFEMSHICLMETWIIQRLETKTNSELLYRAEKFIIWFLDQLEYIKYNSLQAVYKKGELVIHKKLTLLNANTTNRVISSGRLWNTPCETSNFLKYFTITAQCCPLCQFKVFIKF